MAIPPTSATPNRSIPSPLASAWIEQGPANLAGTWPDSQALLENGAARFTNTLELSDARGAEIKVRLCYPYGMVPSTQCEGYLLGRPKGVAGALWEVLRSRDGSTRVQLTTATATDISADANGDNQLTTVDLDKHSFETGGNTEFVFYVVQALAGAGAANARIQLKPW